MKSGGLGVGVDDGLPAEVLLDELGDLGVLEPLSLLQRGEAPPVLGAGIHSTDFQQEPDTLDLALCSGDMEGGAPVVVGRHEVDALHIVPLEGGDVSRIGTEEERHGGQAPGLIPVLGGVVLGLGVAEVVELVEVEQLYEFLRKGLCPFSVVVCEPWTGAKNTCKTTRSRSTLCTLQN